MSHVVRKFRATPATPTSPDTVNEITKKRKWSTVDIQISPADLAEHIHFLDDAVVLRNSPEGAPLMTTTAIYGPIRIGDKVKLTPGKGTGVTVVPKDPNETPLIKELDDLAKSTSIPAAADAAVVNAKWVSATEGGGVPSLDSAANVFGDTGTLLVNEKSVTFPVLDKDHPTYHATLAYYGARLLEPGEEFYLGFDHLLFGVEYNTSLPDYIRNYAMSPSGGGGLFVEHHPFPHIFLPRPTEDGYQYCEAKVTLGRMVELNEYKTELEMKKNPRIRFTTFRIPSNGSAIVIRKDAIHNDSFTNGRLAVYVADTPADTVAFRQTSPFTAISVKDNEKDDQQ